MIIIMIGELEAADGCLSKNVVFSLLWVRENWVHPKKRPMVIKKMIEKKETIIFTIALWA